MVDGGVGVTVLGGIAVVTMVDGIAVVTIVDGIAVVTMVDGIAVVVLEVVVLMTHMSDELTALRLQLASTHSCLCRSIPSEHLDTDKCYRPKGQRGYYFRSVTNMQHSQFL